jgi:spermidine synthase
VASDLTAPSVTRRERNTLLTAVLIISVCALTYELVVATLSSYLLGDSITQFSLTIGFFLFAMGIGSLLSRRIRRDELRWFIIVELAVALFGGTSAILLYATFSSVDVLYYAVMIGVSLAIGICVGLEIPLLTRIVADRSALSEALADVLSIDYIGALIGSLAFPIVLLPLLGVTLTALLMSLCNLLVAMICLHTFRGYLVVRWRRRLWTASVLMVLLMLGGAVVSADLVKILEQQLYSDAIIYTQQTPYQRIIMTARARDYRLFLNGNLQFSTLDEYRYHELLVHPVMALPRSRERVLVLGGGDGFAARELLKYPDVREIVVVDLDPAMTSLAQTFPVLTRLNENSMNDARVTIINADAYSYVQDGDDLFNAVVIDLPDPNNESLSKLYTDTFYRMLERRLTADGAFITQATSPYFARRSFWMIAQTIEAAGFDTIPLQTYVPSFGSWGWVIGTRQSADVLIERLNAVPLVTTRYLTPEVLQTALLFDPDISRVDGGGINTLDHPLLPRTYEEDWRQWN